MSNLLVEFEPGVIRNLRVKNGAETRQVAGIEYEQACFMLETETVHRELIPAENGFLDISGSQTLEISGGCGRLVTKDVPHDSVCVQYAQAAVADVESWMWSKLWVNIQDFKGYALLGTKPETEEAVLVLIDL